MPSLRFGRQYGITDVWVLPKVFLKFNESSKKGDPGKSKY
jgi:hypothetical protein